MKEGLRSKNVLGISGDDRGTLRVLSHGYLTQWHAADRRFVPEIREEYRYTNSLTPDGRAGFWRIDETTLHLFVHGEQSHYALPAGWPRGAGASAGEDLNKHIWVATGTGHLAQLIDAPWSTLLPPPKPTSPSTHQNPFTPD